MTVRGVGLVRRVADALDAIARTLESMAAARRRGRPLLTLAVLGALGIVVFGARSSRAIPSETSCENVVRGLCGSTPGWCGARLADGTPCDYANADTSAIPACLTGGTCKGGVCQGQVPKTGTACDDKNACTYDDKCTEHGTCAGTPITCTSSTCGTSTCNGTARCTVQPLNTGRACTTDAGKPGTCFEGACHTQALKPQPPKPPPPKSELAPKG